MSPSQILCKPPKYQYNITAHDTIPESGRFDNITVDGTAYIYVDSEKFPSLRDQLRAAME